MPTLRKGDIIPLQGTSQYINVLEYIAEGGQGEVYKVEYNGNFYALKWYSKVTPSAEFYENLCHNISMGSPAKCFLWPKAVTKRINGKFGYIMQLKPSSYKEYGDFLTGEARFQSWDLLFKAALNIVESYCVLHSRGYSYQDLNEGSFFIDPDTGDVLICDNDNVAPYGKNLGVKGTPKYMAPEVILNKSCPNTHTDRFSLAVILFRLFYIDHPLEGRYTAKLPITDITGAMMFGKHPVFVYDPNNDSNRPLESAHPNVIQRWNMFPPDINAAFIKAFTDGLKDINSRLNENQWIEVLVKARGMLVRLEGREQFVNAYCPASVPKECRLLRTEEQIIALAPETVLYSCQLDRYSIDFKTRAAMVKASNSDKRIYGLGNLTANRWRAICPNNKIATINPNGFVPLIPGTIIDFGNIKGKVF